MTKAVGLDIGTKNIVLVTRGTKNLICLQEINGYYVFPRPSKFVENMLDDPNKIRSDGTKRPAKWVKFTDKEGIFVLGRDAEELAYAHNDTLLRPMAEGGIAPDDDAMMVLASIVQALLDAAEHDLGKFDEEIKLCYCTTADAINQESNIDYHKQVIDMIISGYESKSKITCDSIKESHAIILKESPDGTGIGISWGAGTVTVSYVLWGQEIYSFCWVGAGDWIDKQVAMRHGYDPKSRTTRSKETPTTVCRQKEQIDLSEPPTDRLLLDIYFHYQLLISNVVQGIAQGFLDNESKARIDKPIPIYMAGGTSRPNGFEQLVKQILQEVTLPFEVSDVLKSNEPLLSVAEGCLIAAEMQ